jgi:deoxyribonuclease IV
MPTSKGLPQAVRDGKAIGCDCIALFTTTPMQWKNREISDELAAEFKQAVADNGIGAVVSHAIYLLNLASPEEENRARSRQAYAEELQRCAKLGIPYAVVHVGKHMGAGEEEGVKRLSESIEWVLGETPREADIAMEIDAGQGTCIGHRFEQLADVISYNKGHERLRICLDTCHMFAAGYDISTPESFASVLDDFDKVLGLDRLKAFHVNDAKKGLGSRIDRHEHIGQGTLGDEVFRFVVNEPRLAAVPLYLETPESETMHEVNLARLRSFLK